MAATLGTSSRLPSQPWEHPAFLVKALQSYQSHSPYVPHVSYMHFRPCWYKADTFSVSYLFRSYILSAFATRTTLFRYHILYLSGPAHPASAKETSTVPTLLRGRALYLTSTGRDAVEAIISISIQWLNRPAEWIACPSVSIRDGS